jgi:hypothetical protein
MRRLRRFTYVVAPKWKFGMRYKIDPSHHLPLCSKCQES